MKVLPCVALNPAESKLRRSLARMSARWTGNRGAARYARTVDARRALAQVGELVALVALHLPPKSRLAEPVLQAIDAAAGGAS